MEANSFFVKYARYFPGLSPCSNSFCFANLNLSVAVCVNSEFNVQRMAAISFSLDPVGFLMYSFSAIVSLVSKALLCNFAFLAGYVGDYQPPRIGLRGFPEQRRAICQRGVERKKGFKF